MLGIERFIGGGANTGQAVALTVELGAFAFEKPAALGANGRTEGFEKMQRIEMTILCKPYGTGHVHLRIWIQLTHTRGIAHFGLHTHGSGQGSDLDFVLQPCLGAAQHHQAARGEIKL